MPLGLDSGPNVTRLLSGNMKSSIYVHFWSAADRPLFALLDGPFVPGRMTASGKSKGAGERRGWARISHLRCRPIQVIQPRFVVYHFLSVCFWVFSIILLMVARWILSVKEERDVDRLSITNSSTNSIASAHQLTTVVVN